MTTMGEQRTMGRRKLLRGVAAAAAYLGLPALSRCAVAAEGAGQPNLIPWPKAVERREGSLKLDAGARIVAADAALAPLAEVLAGEVEAVAGKTFRQGRRASGGRVGVLSWPDTSILPGSESRAKAQ